MNKQELFNQIKSHQKPYIGSKKEVSDDEVTLMDSFLDEKIKGEISFISEFDVKDKKKRDVDVR